MTIYAKLNDGVPKFAPVNYIANGTTYLNFNLDVELMTEYGFKLLIEAEKPDYPYIVSYEETAEEIREVITRDTEREAAIAAEHQAALQRQFFNTSLGYIKRTVTMQDGSTKDFLCDILPLLEVGVPILIYSASGVQSKVYVTQEFISECKNQLLIDFYGVNVGEN